MPTLLLLDSSLSMLGRVKQESTGTPSSPVELDAENDNQFIQLAKYGLNVVLDHLSNHHKMEQVSLLTFGSECETAVPFTRDLQRIKDYLGNIDCFDKTSILYGLRGAISAIEESWGSFIPINIIMVTDGGLGHGPGSLSHFTEYIEEYSYLFPFRFRAKISAMIMGQCSAEEKNSYEKLFSQTECDWSLKIIENEDLKKSSVENKFKEILEEHYKQYIGTLYFGDEMSTKISLSPPPESPYERVKDFHVIEEVFSDKIQIQGFLTLADVASPPIISRHLILPVTTEEESRQSNLCSYLHGPMRLESLCALAKVGSNWYGIIFTNGDKKKSCLMLALFEPGDTPVPWLGNLSQLGPLSALNTSNQDPFPVREQRNPSYGASPVVWIKSTSLVSDVQKVLRHARKIPDKTAHFYRELNRLKRHALSLGFIELLDGLASIFEKECKLLPATSHLDCSVQLTHAAKELRSNEAKGYNYQIQPINSKK